MVTKRMKSRELISSSMELMLVSMVDNKEVSSVLVELLMLVTERVTEVIDTTSDSIEVEVNETVTASTNIWKIKWHHRGTHLLIKSHRDPFDEGDFIHRLSSGAGAARSRQN